LPAALLSLLDGILRTYELFSVIRGFGNTQQKEWGDGEEEDEIGENSLVYGCFCPLRLLHCNQGCCRSVRGFGGNEYL
jgi:hypothetical protein